MFRILVVSYVLLNSGFPPDDLVIGPGGLALGNSFNDSSTWWQLKSYYEFGSLL